MKGFTYILKCGDDSYYIGSTINLEERLTQHQKGQGANHTKKRLPVNLVYVEAFSRIDEAFYKKTSPRMEQKREGSVDKRDYKRAK